MDFMALFSQLSFTSTSVTYSSLVSLMLSIGVLTGCTDPTVDTSMSNTLGQSSSGYAAVLPETKLAFPYDHLPHPNFRQEWWYLTANLETESGKQIGVQWTQFRMAMSPEAEARIQTEASTKSQGWATNQLYLAHTAVTTKDTHLANEKWSREHPQFSAVSASPFKIKLDNWTWEAQGDDLFPALLTVESDQFDYRLALTSDSPLQLQGENGYSRKSADGSVASHYYSQPFIDVKGEVKLNGELISVTGTAWLDREWSSQFLADSQQGWDWFALRLHDGSTLMLFQLRPSNAEQKSFYSGRRMYPDGRGENIPSADISMTPLDYHQVDEGSYPVVWNIVIPTQQINLNINALNKEAKMPLSIPYWEGPVYFNGSHTGEGYMELTGY